MSENTIICKNKKCKREINAEYKYCPFCGKSQSIQRHSRRPTGSGTITCRKDNKLYPYEVRLPAKVDFEGNVIREVLGHYNTRVEAVEALAEWSRTGSKHINWTVEDVYKAWSTTAYKGLSDSTVSARKSSWNKIKAIIGREKIRTLKTADLQKVIDYYAEQDYTYNALLKFKTLISLIYKYAMQEDIVVKDYSKFIKIITQKSIETKTKERFTDIELLKIEQAVGVVPYTDYILAMCYTGFRASEFLALTCDSYHCDNNIPYLIGGGKTKAGTNRIVPIHPKIYKIILDCLARDGDTLFSSYDGTALTYDSFLKRCYKPALKAIGLPDYGCHATRRTFSTRLSAANARQEDMIALMGHTNFDMDIEHYIIQQTDTLYNAILKLDNTNYKIG